MIRPLIVLALATNSIAAVVNLYDMVAFDSAWHGVLGGACASIAAFALVALLKGEGE